MSDDNRWNIRGEPTLYFAGDVRVMAAEWARHVQDASLQPALLANAHPRRIYEARLDVDLVLDLRDPRLWVALGLGDAPACFLDRALCQTTARRVRRETPARGLVVPSVAFLDQLDRWILVVFVDRLPSFPAPFITSVMKQGILPGAL